MLYMAPDGAQYAAIAPPQPQQQATTTERVVAWHNNLDEAMSEASSEAVTVSSATSTVGVATENPGNHGSIVSGRPPYYLWPMRG